MKCIAANEIDGSRVELSTRTVADQVYAFESRQGRSGITAGVVFCETNPIIPRERSGNSPSRPASSSSTRTVADPAPTWDAAKAEAMRTGASFAKRTQSFAAEIGARLESL